MAKYVKNAENPIISSTEELITAIQHQHSIELNNWSELTPKQQSKRKQFPSSQLILSIVAGDEYDNINISNFTTHYHCFSFGENSITFLPSIQETSTK